MSRPRDPAHDDESPDQESARSSTDAIITTDGQFQVTFLNEAATTATGWTMRGARGLPLERMIQSHDPDAPSSTGAHRTPLGLMPDDPGSRTGPASLTTSTGDSIDIHASGAWMRDSVGNITGLVVSFPVSEPSIPSDEFDDMVKSIMGSVNQPIVILDKTLHVVATNAAFSQNMDGGLDATIGVNFMKFSRGLWNSEELRLALWNLIDHGQVIQDLPVTLQPSGRAPRSLRVQGLALPRSSDSEMAIMLTILDEAEHRRNSAALGYSELRYRRLFETAKDGIIIINTTTGLVIDANPFMTQLLGYSLEEFIGKELWEIGLFKEKSDNEQIFAQLRETGYVRYDHLPLVTKEGAEVEVEFVSNCYEVDGQPVGQCNIRDISERRRLERLADEQAETLSELDRQKDEFLAMLSHELRNPLAPILSAVEFLKMAPNSTDEQGRAYEIIIRQTHQLSRLVDDLMEVSRIMTGSFELQRRIIALQDVIHAAVETTRPQMDGRHHRLTVTAPEEPIVLHADAARLEQIIVNLLANAAKYTETGGDINIELERSEDTCLVRVRDSGEGIAPSLIPRIFDLFTQGPRTLERNAGGLGIGLALAHKLVFLHDGRIEVTSRLGHGSEFVVTLPLAIESDQLPHISFRPPLAVKQVSRRVVVVDDNEDAADSLSLLLRASGHEVETSSDGLSALALINSFRPDVVILDIGLPELDGFEVARRIKSMDGLEPVVLIALTGYAHQIDRERSAAAGLDHHLVKPADFSRIQEILQSLGDR